MVQLDGLFIHRKRWREKKLNFNLKKVIEGKNTGTDGMKSECDTPRAESVVFYFSAAMSAAVGSVFFTTVSTFLRPPAAAAMADSTSSGLASDICSGRVTVCHKTRKELSAAAGVITCNAKLQLLKQFFDTKDLGNKQRAESCTNSICVLRPESDAGRGVGG
jgi:hypothetical protein